MQSKTFICALLASASLAATGSFNYKQNGADWSTIKGNELCATGQEQSPIDLDTGLMTTTGRQRLTFDPKNLYSNSFVEV